MALTAKWTAEAEETFEGVIEYLEKNWTEKEIQNFVQSTHKVITHIETNPYMFKSSSREEIRKAVISKHNSLLYYVNEEDGIIELYTFWDNRKDPKKLSY